MYIWHFIGISLSIILTQFKNSLMNKSALWSVLFFGIIDVLLHEIAHWFISAITGGRPYGFSIIPKKEEYINQNGMTVELWEFGCVKSHFTFYNAVAIGMAPLLLLYAAYLTYLYYFEYMPNVWWSILCFYTILYVLIANSIPSVQDFRVPLIQNSWLFYLIIFSILYIAYEFVIKEFINKGGF